jgi:hypothetical protein
MLRVWMQAHNSCIMEQLTYYSHYSYVETGLKSIDLTCKLFSNMQLLGYTTEAGTQRVILCVDLAFQAGGDK